MAIGDSGRVVLEIDPQLKRRLYSALMLEKKSLKNWFVAAAEQFLKDREQQQLFGQDRSD